MFPEKLLSLADECERDCAVQFARIADISRFNTERVMEAFSSNRISERHFTPTSGYGYNDEGREACEKLYADIFGTESALVRHSILNGTHALTIGLFGLLRTGDTLLSVTGKPYDTLDGVIGISGATGNGSLIDYGIKYRQIELTAESRVDLRAVREALAEDDSIKVVYLQRSKGYASRRTLTVAEINEVTSLVHSCSNAFVMVDNCYGAFTEKAEPEADLLVGSLIKNAGGGIAESGAYLVGTEKAVEYASYRYSAVGIGGEAGATLGQTKSIIKGLFFAPHVVGEALKTAVFAASLFGRLGFDVFPSYDEPRSDIIQTLIFGSADALIKFCRGIQSGSPIDSYVAPVPWAMPGYDDEVIMAAGAFTQGSSIELSADGPLRPPYTAYMQGGLTFESGRYCILKAAQLITE